MIIPNDNNKDYRLKKFVEYQFKVPPVHRDILLLYAKENKLNNNQLVLLAWLMSNTYHEITAIIMFESVKYDMNYYENFSKWYIKNESKIQFGSAKKYNKIQRRFLTTIKYFIEYYKLEPYSKLLEIIKEYKGQKNRYEAIIKYNKKCKNHGRFSADLFNEILILFQDELHLKLNIAGSEEFDWINCANLTSAVFNIIYKDELADKFDKGLMTKAELKQYELLLLSTIKQIQIEINNTYGKKIDTPMFITKLCSFRNLFKNARYGGYHHDRQLEYLLKYNKELPEKKELYKKILNYRSKSFSNNLLGEKNNWKGIRPHRKKLWTKYGLTGVEEISKNL